MTPDWPALRKQFPVTERCIYLNTGWSGPSSREGVAAMQQRLEREAYDGPTTLEVRNEKALLVRRVRGAIAALIRADIDEVAITYTTTDCVNTVLRGIGLKPGDNVVTCNLEHNAVMVPSYLTRNRDGIDLSIVRLSPEQAAREVVDAFDAAITPATKLVLVSHVSYNRGTRLPIREITEIAHSRGALVAVDAAQSAGQIDFDVRDLNCDFLALPGHKWLLGPDGAAFLYVRSDLIEFLQPLAVVHGANRNYDFEGNFDYANDTIHKFELTTHSGPVLAGLEVSLQMVAQLGIPTIEARCLSLADRFIARLQLIDDVRITTPLDPALRSGIVTLAIRDHDPNQLAAALYDSARIVARVCNNRRVRVCFHIFNDESDVDRTVDAVAQIAARGIPAGTPTE
ncbi:MAG TPA: aminotransferase class V-fold PLP-dependent enzyme, partial [Dehalococcoidia bacterium]